LSNIWVVVLVGARPGTTPHKMTSNAVIGGIVWGGRDFSSRSMQSKTKNF